MEPNKNLFFGEAAYAPAKASDAQDLENNKLNPAEATIAVAAEAGPANSDVSGKAEVAGEANYTETIRSKGKEALSGIRSLGSRFGNWLSGGITRAKERFGSFTKNIGENVNTGAELAVGTAIDDIQHLSKLANGVKDKASTQFKHSREKLNTNWNGFVAGFGERRQARIKNEAIRSILSDLLDETGINLADHPDPFSSLEDQRQAAHLQVEQQFNYRQEKLSSAVLALAKVREMRGKRGNLSFAPAS